MWGDIYRAVLEMGGGGGGGRVAGGADSLGEAFAWETGFVGGGGGALDVVLGCGQVSVVWCVVEAFVHVFSFLVRSGDTDSFQGYSWMA